MFGEERRQQCYFGGSPSCRSRLQDRRERRGLRVTWLSKGLMTASSVLNWLPNMEYESEMGGGGLGVRPRFTFSSLNSVTYCMGGSGSELTCAVSDIFSFRRKNTTAAKKERGCKECNSCVFFLLLLLLPTVRDARSLLRRWCLVTVADGGTVLPF